MPIGDYCTRQVHSIDPEATALEAAQHMSREGIGSLVVLHKKRVLGVLTDRDIALGILREGHDADEICVASLVAKDPVVIHESSPVGTALGVMKKNALRRLPVVDTEQALVGIITADDLLQLFTRELSDLADVVEAQGRLSHGVGQGIERDLEASK